MFWQYLLVGGMVALAVGFLGRQLWRSTKGCGGGCHCSSRKQNDVSAVGQVTLIPEDQLKMRRRS
jgi:hypothetical protein